MSQVISQVEANTEKTIDREKVRHFCFKMYYFKF